MKMRRTNGACSASAGAAFELAPQAAALEAAAPHDALGCEAPGAWDGPHTGGMEMSDFSQVDWGFSAHTEALDLKRRVDAAEKRLLLMETAIEALVTNLERVLGVLERMKP